MLTFKRLGDTELRTLVRGVSRFAAFCCVSAMVVFIAGCPGTVTAPCTTNADCDDGNACTDDVCDVDLAICASTPIDCPDGETCVDGVCVATCQADADCDDSLLCTNDACTYGACDNAPVTCEAGVCNPDDGQCIGCFEDANCDDGDACTGAETCVDNACVDGTPVVCADGEVCNADGACVATCTDDAGCDDGDACNGDETCVDGACASGTLLDCDDGIDCTDDACANDVCSNTDNCTAGTCNTDTGECDIMACTSGTECDDGNDCTDDSCEGGACVNANNTDACDDTDACTTGDACADGVCAGTATDCGTQTCDPVTGNCVDCSDDADCDDGIECTVDICNAGTCENTDSDPRCNDGLFCTGTETCDPNSEDADVEGCVASGDPCDPLSFTPICEERTESCSACILNADCDDGVACTDDSCDEVNDVVVNTVNDANCNITSLVDTAGDAIERYVYNPYGGPTIYDSTWGSTRSTSSYDNTLRFAGYRYDAETGLYLARNRFLHAELGNWLRRDPIGYAGGDLNLYGYVGGDPENSVDPEGLIAPIIIAILFGAAFGGTT
ncbi:MAG: RHS repeat-associated core domain-containing protein, partial [Planctomycetes bacterium]|nr:RHS repeat-associated core domain-containing protein [Planctomycetota bacterium]